MKAPAPADANMGTGAALRGVRRCTYCRGWKDLEEFTREGDDVIPASMGGTWIDHNVCETCNKQANRIADEIIAHDFLIRLLRSRHQVPGRNGNIPKPPIIAIRPAGGGVIKVELAPSGPRYQAGLPSMAIEELGLDDPTDHDHPSGIVDAALAPLSTEDRDQAREVARRGQPLPTPPDSWSRFMAKVVLACGRDAYGEEWLDARQATILSDDLLRGQPPRFAQRWFYPPVEPAWPFEPPKHRLWIQASDQTVILWIAVFGEVIGAVPIGDAPAPTRATPLGHLTRSAAPASRACTAPTMNRRTAPASLSARPRRERTSSPSPSVGSSTSTTGPTAQSTSGSRSPASTRSTRRSSTPSKPPSTRHLAGTRRRRSLPALVAARMAPSTVSRSGSESAGLATEQ